MLGGLIPMLRRPVACVLLTACCPLHPLLALGGQVPAIAEEMAEDVPDPDLEAQWDVVEEEEEKEDAPEPEVRSSVCRKLTLGALILGAAAYLGGFIGSGTAPEPVQPMAGTGLDLDTLGLGPAPASPPGAWLGPMPLQLTSGPVSDRTTFGSVPHTFGALPEPRTFRMVRDPGRMPPKAALRSFSNAAHVQYQRLTSSITWAVTRHRWNDHFLAEGIRAGASPAALEDLIENARVSRRIFETYDRFRQVLRRYPSFCEERGGTRSGRRRRVDPQRSLAAIVRAEAELNEIYTDFLRFAQDVETRDRTRIGPPSANRDDLAAEAGILERILEALTATRIGWHRAQAPEGAMPILAGTYSLTDRGNVSRP